MWINKYFSMLREDEDDRTSEFTRSRFKRSAAQSVCDGLTPESRWGRLASRQNKKTTAFGSKDFLLCPWHCAFYRNTALHHGHTFLCKCNVAVLFPPRTTLYSILSVINSHYCSDI